MKIKNIVVVIIILGVISALALISKQLGKEVLATEQLISLPNINVTQMDSSYTTLSSLSDGSPLLLVLVNSECAICHGQVEELYKRGHKLEGIDIILLSHQELGDIQEFANAYPDAPFVFGQVDLDILSESFGKFSTPHLFLYDKGHQLIKELKGVNRVVHLKKHFE